MLSNLPEVPTGFVGRGGELAHLADALARDRLVTLTGPGGVGKSRLALHAADRAWHDGRSVAWADLWQLRDDRLLVAVVADALDFADHTAATPLDTLSAWVGDRDLVLVLDSCEGLLNGCRALVTHLLEACPRLTVLTTSREHLGLADEHRIAVEPLPVATDAVRLLCERAAAAGTPLAGPQGLVTAARLCHALEGVPLAIELAAGHLAHQDIDQIERVLRARLDLHGARGFGPPHHRVLRTAIGWSHELCEPAERLLWARLSVFRGAVDAGTVVAVCGSGPLPPEEAVRALEGLERRSVVKRDGERYRMLDTVREYGRMWLDELGESAEALDRHAQYFRDRVRAADAAWFGPGQIHAYRWIDAAHTDLCAALDHLLDARPEAALDLGGRLGFFWSCCGHLREATDYLEDALSQCKEPGPTRIRALWALGVTLVLRGEAGRAQGLAEVCREEAERWEDTDGILRSGYLLGLTHLLGGRPLIAAHQIDQAFARMGGGVPDTASAVLCRLARVFALTGQGFLEQARDEAESLRRRSLARGEWWTRSYADYQLAVIALFEDRARDAVVHARSMLEGKRRIGDSFGLALGLDVLAAALAAQGAGEPAVAAYATSETYWSAVGHPQRGTPELGPVRVQYERTARSLLGDDRYDQVALESVVRGPDQVLGEILGQSAQGS
ncbi:ATP-binding protein [Streptomyces krungchingensis]